MNKKDIALTVGGVVATIAFSYWIYVQQSASQASAAPAVDTEAEAAEQNAALGTYSYVPSASYSTGTSSDSSADGSGSLAPYTPTDTADLISGILNAVLPTVTSDEGDYTNALTTLGHTAAATAPSNSGSNDNSAPAPTLNRPTASVPKAPADLNSTPRLSSPSASAPMTLLQQV